MRQNGRQMMLDLFSEARAYRISMQTALVRAWERVSAEQRRAIRNHAVAIAAVAAATVLTLALGLQTAGPMLLADLVIAAAAWFGGFSTGCVAALAAVLVARIFALPITGTAIESSLALLLCIKGVIVAMAFAALSASSRADGQRLSELDQRIQQMLADARKRKNELAEMEASSAEAHARLQHEADVAHRQLTTLQSVTDPALNTLNGDELLISLLDRMCHALGADGVALYSVERRGGRICSASSGIAPLGRAGSRQPVFSDYQNGRTALIQNDAGRVVDTSLCQWPDDVTSLIAVPIVHTGRLQLVLEVANYRARRATEWELALIQVVAERAAGLLRQDAYVNADAVA
jgi:GAF domain-containing protein